MLKPPAVTRAASVRSRNHSFLDKIAKPPVVELELNSQLYGTTQILDFLQSAPLLQTLWLQYSTPGSSDASPGRRVFLHHLKDFTIKAGSLPSVLFCHHRIPTRAPLTPRFSFDAEDSSFLDHFSTRSPNFNVPSDIAALRLFLHSHYDLTDEAGIFACLPP